MVTNTSFRELLEKRLGFNFSLKNSSFLICLILSSFIWFAPVPAGLDPSAMRLLSIFVFTILGLILKPYPTSMIVLMSLTMLVASKTLTFSQAFSGFSNEIVWLIVLAFFIARSFVKTGLGTRVAYQLMSVIGKSTLGMGYGLVFTDWILASAIPSVTARTGGVIFPIVKSLCSSLESEPDSNPKRVGAYLMQVVFQASGISSAMFLTAMSGNVIMQKIALDMGLNVTWASWAIAAFVPGLCCLLLLPLVFYWVYPPEMKRSEKGQQIAREKLKQMGKITYNEWVLIFTFAFLIILWSMSGVIGLSPTITALIGLIMLLMTDVLTVDDLLSEKSAWDTLIWFSVLIAMASFLTKFGLIQWFSSSISGPISTLPWVASFVLLMGIYYYSHYMFASNVAHVSALFAPFFLLSIKTGTPSMLAFIILAMFSSMFGGLTTYSSGPAPLFYGAGYVSTKDWFKLGVVASLIFLFVIFTVTPLWLSLLGYSS
jgi:divalent anion:Na+ symporter, DASS family